MPHVVKIWFGAYVAEPKTVYDYTLYVVKAIRQTKENNVEESRSWINAKKFHCFS